MSLPHRGSQGLRFRNCRPAQARLTLQDVLANKSSQKAEKRPRFGVSGVGVFVVRHALKLETAGKLEIPGVGAGEIQSSKVSAVDVDVDLIIACVVAKSSVVGEVRAVHSKD